MSASSEVWVPGGSGMLGRAVCRSLATRGLKPLVTGRDVDIATDSVVEGFVAQHVGMRAIINCAAKTAVDACEQEQEDAMRTNGEGPRCLALAGKRLGIPLVHVSTDYVFAGDASSAYLEQDATAPVTVYGQSKLRGERAMWEILPDTSLGYVVRTAWLFGHEGNNFVRTMLRLMAERDRVQVVNDQLGSPTFCDDLAEALVALAGVGGATRVPGGTYHFVNSGQTSWHGLAQATWRAARSRDASLRCQHVEPVSSEAFVRPAKRPAFSVLSNEKLARALGQWPRDWSEALAAYLQGEFSMEAAH